jgi:hypothetical protein
MYGDTTARQRTFEDVLSIILLFALLLAFKREAQCRHFAATLGRRCRLIWVQFQPWRLRRDRQIQHRTRSRLRSDLFAASPLIA